MNEPRRLRTPEELRVIEEKNYHGAIQALFASSSQELTVRDVVELIEQRFGMSGDERSQMTNLATTEMLASGILAAQEHLRPDTIDWYNQRIAYLLSCAKSRMPPES